MGSGASSESAVSGNSPAPPIDMSSSPVSGINSAPSGGDGVVRVAAKPGTTSGNRPVAPLELDDKNKNVVTLGQELQQQCEQNTGHHLSATTVKQGWVNSHLNLRGNVCFARIEDCQLRLSSGNDLDTPQCIVSLANVTAISAVDSLRKIVPIQYAHSVMKSQLAFVVTTEDEQNRVREFHLGCADVDCTTTWRNAIIGQCGAKPLTWQSRNRKSDHQPKQDLLAAHCVVPEHDGDHERWLYPWPDHRPPCDAQLITLQKTQATEHLVGLDNFPFVVPQSEEEYALAFLNLLCLLGTTQLKTARRVFGPNRWADIRRTLRCSQAPAQWLDTAIQQSLEKGRVLPKCIDMDLQPFQAVDVPCTNSLAALRADIEREASQLPEAEYLRLYARALSLRASPDFCRGDEPAILLDPDTFCNEKYTNSLAFDTTLPASGCAWTFDFEDIDDGGHVVDFENGFLRDSGLDTEFDFSIDGEVAWDVLEPMDDDETETMPLSRSQEEQLLKAALARARALPLRCRPHKHFLDNMVLAQRQLHALCDGNLPPTNVSMATEFHSPSDAPTTYDTLDWSEKEECMRRLIRKITRKSESTGRLRRGSLTAEHMWNWFNIMCHAATELMEAVKKTPTVSTRPSREVRLKYGQELRAQMDQNALRSRTDITPKVGSIQHYTPSGADSSVWHNVVALRGYTSLNEHNVRGVGVGIYGEEAGTPHLWNSHAHLRARICAHAVPILSCDAEQSMQPPMDHAAATMQFSAWVCTPTVSVAHLLQFHATCAVEDCMAQPRATPAPTAPCPVEVLQQWTAKIRSNGVNFNLNDDQVSCIHVERIGEKLCIRGHTAVSSSNDASEVSTSTEGSLWRQLLGPSQAERLVLRRLLLTRDSLHCLVEALRLVPSVYSIDVLTCQFEDGDAGLAFFHKAVSQHCPQVKTLCGLQRSVNADEHHVFSRSHMLLGMFDCHVLCHDLFRSAWNDVNTIKLNGNPLTGGARQPVGCGFWQYEEGSRPPARLAIARLWAALASRTSLIHLDLSCCGIGPGTLLQMSQAAPSFPSLQVLVLHNNPIGCVAAPETVHSLHQTASQLTVTCGVAVVFNGRIGRIVDISGPRVNIVWDDDGLYSGWIPIQRVQLAEHNMPAEEHNMPAEEQYAHLHALSKMLGASPALKAVDLSSCRLNPMSAAVLMAGTASWSQLDSCVSVRLDCNGIFSWPHLSSMLNYRVDERLKECKCLLFSLENLPRHRLKLSMCNTGAGPGSVRALRAALPRLAALTLNSTRERLPCDEAPATLRAWCGWRGPYASGDGRPVWCARTGPEDGDELKYRDSDPWLVEQPSMLCFNKNKQELCLSGMVISAADATLAAQWAEVTPTLTSLILDRNPIAGEMHHFCDDRGLGTFLQDIESFELLPAGTILNSASTAEIEELLNLRIYRGNVMTQRWQWQRSAVPGHDSVQHVHRCHWRSSTKKPLSDNTELYWVVTEADKYIDRAAMLFDGLRHCVSLQTLSLCRVGMGPLSVKMLQQSIVGMRSLNTLHLDSTTCLGRTSSIVQPRSYKLCATDKELDLEAKGLGEADASLLSTWISLPQVHEHLRTLSVLRNPIGEAGLAELMEAVEAMPQVGSVCGLRAGQSEVDWSGVGLQSMDIAIIAADLQLGRHVSSLRSMCLLRNPCIDVKALMPALLNSSVHSICGLIESQTAVKWSGLDHCSWTVIALDLQLRRRSSSLRHLELRGGMSLSTFRQPGVWELLLLVKKTCMSKMAACAALRRLTPNKAAMLHNFGRLCEAVAISSLESVSFHSIGLCSDAGDVLCHLVRSCPSLRSLCILGNPDLGVDMVAAIVDEARSQTELRSISGIQHGQTELHEQNFGSFDCHVLAADVTLGRAAVSLHGVSLRGSANILQLEEDVYARQDEDNRLQAGVAPDKWQQLRDSTLELVAEGDYMGAVRRVFSLRGGLGMSEQAKQGTCKPKKESGLPSFTKLCASIASCPLVSIDFAGCALGTTAIRQVAQILVADSSLKKLRMHSEGSIEYFLQATDVELDLEAKGLGEADASLLSTWISLPQVHEHLRTLSVLRNPIGEAGLAELMEAVEAMPQVGSVCGLRAGQSEVDWSGVGLQSMDIAIIAADLQLGRHVSSLRSMCLLRNPCIEAAQSRPGSDARNHLDNLIQRVNSSSVRSVCGLKDGQTKVVWSQPSLSDLLLLVEDPQAPNITALDLSGHNLAPRCTPSDNQQPSENSFMIATAFNDEGNQWERFFRAFVSKLVVLNLGESAHLGTSIQILPMTTLRLLTVNIAHPVAGKPATYTLDVAASNVTLPDMGLGVSDASILASWFCKPAVKDCLLSVNLRGNPKLFAHSMLLPQFRNEYVKKNMAYPYGHYGNDLETPINTALMNAANSDLITALCGLRAALDLTSCSLSWCRMRQLGQELCQLNGSFGRRISIDSSWHLDSDPFAQHLEAGMVVQNGSSTRRLLWWRYDVVWKCPEPKCIRPHTIVKGAQSGATYPYMANIVWASEHARSGAQNISKGTPNIFLPCRTSCVTTPGAPRTGRSGAGARMRYILSGEGIRTEMVPCGGGKNLNMDDSSASLDFRDASLWPSDLAFILGWLQSSSTEVLTSLALCGNDFVDGHEIMQLLRWFDKTPRVQTLTGLQNGVTDILWHAEDSRADARLLGADIAAARATKSVRTLTLTCVQGRKISLQAEATSLELTRAGLTIKDAIVLAGWLARSDVKSTLASCDLSDNPAVGDEVMGNLLRSFRGSSVMTSLNLSSCSLSHRAAHELAHMETSRLATLYLANNPRLLVELATPYCYLTASSAMAVHSNCHRLEPLETQDECHDGKSKIRVRVLDKEGCWQPAWIYNLTLTDIECAALPHNAHSGDTSKTQKVIDVEFEPSGTSLVPVPADCLLVARLWSDAEPQFESDSCTEAMMPLLAKLLTSTLEQLDLSGCGKYLLDDIECNPDYWAASVLSLLKNAPRLTTLSLLRNCLSLECISELQAYREDHPSLNSLCGLQAGTKHASFATSSAPMCRSSGCYLSSNVDGDCMLMLADLSRFRQSVQSLTVGADSHRHAGRRRKKWNRHLNQEVDRDRAIISDCQLVQSICDELLSCSDLTSLELCGVRLAREPALLLFQHLPQVSTLTSLGLNLGPYYASRGSILFDQLDECFPADDVLLHLFAMLERSTITKLALLGISDWSPTNNVNLALRTSTIAPHRFLPCDIVARLNEGSLLQRLTLSSCNGETYTLLTDVKTLDLTSKGLGLADAVVLAGWLRMPRVASHLRIINLLRNSLSKRGVELVLSAAKETSVGSMCGVCADQVEVDWDIFLGDLQLLEAELLLLRRHSDSLRVANLCQTWPIDSSDSECSAYSSMWFSRRRNFVTLGRQAVSLRGMPSEVQHCFAFLALAWATHAQRGAVFKRIELDRISAFGCLQSYELNVDAKSLDLAHIQLRSKDVAFIARWLQLPTAHNIDSIRLRTTRDNDNTRRRSKFHYLTSTNSTQVITLNQASSLDVSAKSGHSRRYMRVKPVTGTLSKADLRLLAAWIALPRVREQLSQVIVDCSHAVWRERTGRNLKAYSYVLKNGIPGYRDATEKMKSIPAEHALVIASWNAHRGESMLSMPMMSDTVMLPGIGSESTSLPPGWPALHLPRTVQRKEIKMELSWKRGRIIPRRRITRHAARRLTDAEAVVLGEWLRSTAARPLISLDLSRQTAIGTKLGALSAAELPNLVSLNISGCALRPNDLQALCTLLAKSPVHTIDISSNIVFGSVQRGDTGSSKYEALLQAQNDAASDMEEALQQERQARAHIKSEINSIFGEYRGYRKYKKYGKGKYGKGKYGKGKYGNKYGPVVVRKARLCHTVDARMTEWRALQNSMARLTTVRAQNIGLGAAGAKLFAAELGASITHLDVSRNVIGDDGLHPLLQALETKALVYLGIEACKATASTATALASVLPSWNTTIAELRLGANNWNCFAQVCELAGVEPEPEQSEPEPEGNCIPEPPTPFMQLCTAIGLSHCATVSFARCGISFNSGLDAVIALVQSHNLRKLDLSSNDSLLTSYTYDWTSMAYVAGNLTAHSEEEIARTLYVQFCDALRHSSITSLNLQRCGFMHEEEMFCWEQHPLRGLLTAPSSFRAAISELILCSEDDAYLNFRPYLRRGKHGTRIRAKKGLPTMIPAWDRHWLRELCGIRASIHASRRATHQLLAFALVLANAGYADIGEDVSMHVAKRVRAQQLQNLQEAYARRIAKWGAERNEKQRMWSYEVATFYEDTTEEFDSWSSPLTFKFPVVDESASSTHALSFSS